MARTCMYQLKCLQSESRRLCCCEHDHETDLDKTLSKQVYSRFSKALVTCLRPSGSRGCNS